MTSNQRGSYDWGDTRATMGWNKGTPNRKVEQILENIPQFGLRAATRPHEAGIASNRKSASLR